jgi:CRP-like cAMP-binding protein
MISTAKPPTGGAAAPLLRQTELRNLLTETQLQELERFCLPHTRSPGVTLFRQGEPADTFYLLVEGMAELRARPPGRRGYRTVEVIGPSCTLGDEALFGEGCYFAGARVIEPSRVLALSRPAFDSLASGRPDIAVGVLRCAASCLVNTLRRAAVLTQAPADLALRTLLNELATSASPNGMSNGSVPVHITHAQLAGVLHVSRETVSRMLGQLAQEGALEIGRGVIRVNPN